jgi:hypothetical protein
MEKDYSAKIKSMRNLALFKDKTDEEILQFIKKREENQKVAADPSGPEAPVKQTRKKSNAEDDTEYEELFTQKLETLQKEYGVDMNNANDAEMLRSLVQHSIQKDVVNKQIIKLQREDELDTRTLKNLGDYQKGLVDTINNLQEKLGINRKQRKEKQVESIPQFVELVRSRAREVWDRETVSIRCENCEITLATYWLNFPLNATVVKMEIECDRCHERVIYNR